MRAVARRGHVAYPQQLSEQHEQPQSSHWHEPVSQQRQHSQPSQA